jgi:hypothetical protein
MDVQSQLLFIGSSADIKIMVAERKGVSRLAEKTQHTRRCPPPVPPQRGHEGSSLKDCSFNAFRNGLLKPTGNVGQQAKDSVQPFCSQAHKMTFDLN